MARILVLALLTIASLLLPPVVASQQAAAKCEYRKHSGHRYRHPVGVRKIVVDAGGAGDFVSIQRAVDSVPEGNTVRVIVQINAGTYIEKVVVPASKPYVTFQGAGRDVTVVKWHDRASDRGPDGQPLRTYNTASVTILANYFNAKNISFKVSSRLPSRPPSTWPRDDGAAGAGKVTKPLRESQVSGLLLLNAAVSVYLVPFRKF